jgi:preprotein translocase subunit SecG
VYVFGRVSVQANPMIYGLLVVVHVIICVFLVIVVLLQSGKAADLAGAFGGMGSQTAFGPRGSATILSKATEVAAGLFMVTSLTLAIMASRSTPGVGSSVLETSPIKQSAPAQSRPLQRTPALPAIPQAGGGVSGGSKSQPVPVPQQSAPAQPAPAKK